MIRQPTVLLATPMLEMLWFMGPVMSPDSASGTVNAYCFAPTHHNTVNKDHKVFDNALEPSKTLEAQCIVMREINDGHLNYISAFFFPLILFYLYALLWGNFIERKRVLRQ